MCILGGAAVVPAAARTHRAEEYTMRRTSVRKIVVGTLTLVATAALGLGFSSEAWAGHHSSSWDGHSSSWDVGTHAKSSSWD